MKFGMINEKCVMRKAGVSLITVLLFMLIATIAATATYKWITSEGHSSASRMMEREAYQSSIAGIENARAWMTFRANETGALIRQYIYDFSTNKPKSERKPINIDKQIRSFGQGKAMGQGNHVWLVGVNTDGPTYKVKILSEGFSRDGQARHSEVAIFNVSGLYQVDKPKVNVETESNADFDYAYFGGSYTGAGSVTITSATVNGDWTGNPMGLTGNFIVTGTATLSGSNLALGPLSCIGKDFKPQNAGMTGQNLFVGGNTTGNVTVTGQAYFDGNFENQDGGLSNFDSSVTVNGLFKPKATLPLTVHGDFCTTEQGAIVSTAGSDANDKVFEVEGNVWMPGAWNVRTEACVEVWWPSYKKTCGDNSSIYHKIYLGSKETSDLYIKSAYPSSNYSTLRTSKTFTENKSWKKNCPTSFQSAGYWDWQNNFVFVGNGSYDICGKQGWWSPTNGEVYTTYWLGWNNWGGDSYTAYPSMTAADDKYYIYNTGDKQDVEFKEYNNNSWKYYVGPAKTHSGYTDTGKLLDWNQYSRNGFLQSFRSPTPVGAYFVGGELFYDMGSTYKTYNYENSKPTGSPYCKKSSNAYRPECGVTPWFKSSAANLYNKDNYNWSNEKPFLCADSVKIRCNKIWKEGEGCPDTKYTIKDPLVTAKDSDGGFGSYASNGCAAGITQYNGSLVTDLNACYKQLNTEEKRNDSLYNGFLVVRVSGGTSSTNPDGKLEGRFIIIATDAIYSSLLDVEDTSYVFYYLEKGANTITGKEGISQRKNTFIYSDEEITYFQNMDLTGTLYFPASSCKGIDKRMQGVTLTNDKALIDTLFKAGIICNNVEGSSCGGTSLGTNTESLSTTITYGSNGKDPYYISMAPQLGVTLESQYESSEQVPVLNDNDGVKELGQSFIVLPRTIYLTRDPYGKLSDYYNVIPLNGAEVTKATANVTCDKLSTDLVSGDTKLNEGLYTCTAAPDGLDPVDFYVWVKGTQSSSPTINFLEESANLTASISHEVKINLPPHSSDLEVRINVSDLPSESWTLTPGPQYKGKEGSTYTFKFSANLEGHDFPTVFTLTPPADASNGSVMFTLQPPESEDAYRLTSPWVSSLVMASTANLTNSGYSDESVVGLTEINTWCETHSGCPEASVRGNWPKCPYATSKEWVIPDWTPPGYSGKQEDKNRFWSVVTSGTGTLKLKEKGGSGCVVIIPEQNNQKDAPINIGDNITLRAIAKAASHRIKLQFVGDVGSGKKPFVTLTPGSRDGITCSNTSTDRTCTISVFDGENIKLHIDKEDLGKQNENFSYWLCKNNDGNTCPTLEPITSADYNEFEVKDDEAVIEIHFGEHDDHCFFDEFRRTQSDNNNHACENSGESEYCIGTGGTAKWKLLPGESIDHVERDYYQGYITASKNAPKTGVKVMSTVQAGIHGTLKALFQLPHATESYGNDSPKILNSGFMLRSTEDASEFLRLNVYENVSGYLEARVCLYDGTENKCLAAQQLHQGNSILASVYPTSMIMMAATLEKNTNKLTLKAFTGAYYYNNTSLANSMYTAEFNLSNLDKNLATMNYEHVGFSLADRDFKIYGIGWESQDYGSQCFDGPPSVKCSFAASAAGGIIPTYGDLPGQSTEYQVPWVGHSGWFDSKECSVSYSYEGGNDTRNVDEHGYQFEQEGAGAHGYKDGENNVKTAFATLSCSETDIKTVAWEVVDPAHCGPFWTGMYSVCNSDVDILSSNVTVDKGETRYLDFSQKNLRGIDDLTISLSNDYSSDVILEVWLESQSDGNSSSNYESRHVEIKGSTATITRQFSVAPTNSSDKEDFAKEATGFDPEKVVAIAFKNNGEYGVTLKQVQATCENSVHFKGCSLEKVSGSEAWKITVEVDKNPSSVNMVYVSATVDGNAENYLSDSKECPNCFEITVLDPKIYQYANLQYVFSARVVAPDYDDTKACDPPLAPSAITCSPASIEPIGSGESWPQFKFALGNCPSSGCSYNVSLSPTDASPFKTVENAANGNHTETHSGKAPDCNQEGGCTYTYTVNSTEDLHPFSCSTEFIVRKKGKEELELNCQLSNVVGTVGVDPSTAGSVTATKGCGDGETCTWTIVDKNENEVGSGTFGDTPYSFDAADEAGSYEYEFKVTQSGGDTKSCPKFTVSYPLNLECGTFNDDTPKTIGSSITPAAPTIKSGSVSGCKNKCSYAVTGGGSVSGGSGSNANGTTVTSFTDASATGSGSTFTVNYTLTVSKDGVDNLECPFNVVYSNGGSGGVSATCNITNTDGGSALYEGQQIQMRLSDISGISDNVEMTWTFDGSDNTIKCNSQGCWENEITAPDAATYSYSVTYNGTPLSGCSGNVTINPVLECSVSPTPPTQYSSYTFTATRNVNCYNCVFTHDVGTETNVQFPGQFTDGENTLTRTRDAAVAGAKTLGLECACNNSYTGSCSVPVTITESAGSTENVDLSSGYHDFKLGTTYKITKCNSIYNNYICDSNGGGHILVVNGQEKWTSFDWQSLNSGWQGTGTNCAVGDEITVKNGMLRCKNYW